MRYKAILIDFDNTIIGTEKYNHSIFLEEMSRLAGRQLTHKDSRDFAGHTWKGIFRILHEKHIQEMSPEAIRQVFVDAKIEFFKDKTAPLADGLEEVLSLDVKKALVTGSSRREVDMFSHLINFSRFDVIATDELYDRGKPAPDGYLYAVEQLGFEPSDCLCIEDSKIGLASAEAAGCTTVFTKEFANEGCENLADYTVNKLRDVLKLLV